MDEQEPLDPVAPSEPAADEASAPPAPRKPRRSRAPKTASEAKAPKTKLDDLGREVYADGKPRAHVYTGLATTVVPALSYELREQDLPGHVEPGQVVTTTLVLGPPFRVKE